MMNLHGIGGNWSDLWQKIGKGWLLCTARKRNGMDGMAWTFRAGLGLVEYVMKCPKVFRNPSCD